LFIERILMESRVAVKEKIVPCSQSNDLALSIPRAIIARSAPVETGIISSSVVAIPERWVSRIAGILRKASIDSLIDVLLERLSHRKVA
jgi:hypothetical protein